MAEKQMLIDLIDCYECIAELERGIEGIFELPPRVCLTRAMGIVDNLILSNCKVGIKSHEADEYDEYYGILDDENLTKEQKYKLLMEENGR